MCVTLAKARLSDTTLYAAEVKVGNQVVHVCGYQNKVQNLSTVESSRQTEEWSWATLGKKITDSKDVAMGNAMILPFPAVPSSMCQENIIPTHQCNFVLSDMANAITNSSIHKKISTISVSRAVDFDHRVEVFDSGIYTVVLAQDARSIPAALKEVPAAKRPNVNKSIFMAYAQWYPQWALALCCFNNKDAAMATPMLWWYKSIYPELLFAPALDSHTGEVPNFNVSVDVDHAVAVGSYRMNKGLQISYSDDIPFEVRPYILQKIVGYKFQGLMPNGDFVCRTEDVREGIFEPKRLSPPGA